MRGELFFAQRLERADRHAAREKAGANRVHGDVVRAPFAGQRAREVDDRAFGRVVGNRLHAARVAAQAGNRRHIDDAARLARNHAVLGDVLRQDEVATHIEVHHLVPGLDRMVFSRCAPSRAGVVNQNIHMAKALDGLVGQCADVGFFGAVGGNPVHVNAGRFQGGSRFNQVFGFARTQHDFGTRFAQRLRHLQAQAARAASHEGGFALEVKQLLNGAGHKSPWGGLNFWAKNRFRNRLLFRSGHRSIHHKSKSRSRLPGAPGICWKPCQSMA